MVRGLRHKEFSFPAFVMSWGGAKLNCGFSKKIVDYVMQQIRDCEVIVILHFGANNIGARRVETRQVPEVFVNELKCLLNELSVMQNVSVVVSSILPRPGGDLKVETMMANSLVKALCNDYGENVRFSHSYKPFLKNDCGDYSVDDSLFKSGDIHLNLVGREKFESVLNIAAENAKF